jgi:hypothetical protein
VGGPDHQRPHRVQITHEISLSALSQFPALADPSSSPAHEPSLRLGSIPYEVALSDQWIATAKDCECRIVFPAPKIKTDLDPLEPDFKTIKVLTGDHFHSLFHRVVSYEPQDKKTFRDDVSRYLADSAATQLLDICTSPSEPKAVWKALPKPAKGKSA